MLPGMAMPLLVGSSRANVVWNPSDKSAQITLSNGNKTATTNGATGTMPAVRAVSPGNEYSVLIGGSMAAGANVNIGFGNTSASLSSFVGTANGVGYRPTPGDGRVFNNGAGAIATLVEGAVGDVVTVSVSGFTFSVKLNGALLGSATHTVTGTLYPMCSLPDAGLPRTTLTLV